MPVEIPLTSGGFTLVDEEDAERVLQHRWYRLRKTGDDVHHYAKSTGNPSFYLHRFIIGARPGFHVDHVNGDTLDNRRENLREVTPSQNMQNRRGVQKNSLTGVRNVKWHKGMRLFGVSVKVNRKSHFIGYFRDIESAEKAAIYARQKFMTHSEV